jgi:ribosomal protein S27AE
MSEWKSGQRNQVTRYRRACSRCGALTIPEHIEPADEPGHELRTFECTNCGHYEVVKMRFR